MYYSNDTIAAIATGTSESGIGIIRVSGPESWTVIGRLFRTGRQVSSASSFDFSGSSGHFPELHWKPNTIHYGYIVDPDSGEILDEVLVSWFKGPHSYTCEDTAEINTHGGPFVLQKVLSAVLRAGARPADPGEFTKRAFLNGRIDLSEAEAVMGLISSQNDFSRRVSLSQLRGSVSDSVRGLRAELLHEMAFIEAALDDPEHYSLDGYSSVLREKCLLWINKIRHILDLSNQGAILRNGISVVIVGRPNTGKSSLLNALSQRNRAIVTDIPGTTRDTLEEIVRCGDLLLRITDTAGIRETEDEIEKIGVRRSFDALNSAQLILLVLDGSVPLNSDDYDIARQISQYLHEGRQCIILLNKMDAVASVSSSSETDNQAADNLKYLRHLLSEDCEILRISAMKGDGLDELMKAIYGLFLHGDISDSAETILSGERQMSEARSAASSLGLVLNSMSMNVSEEFYMVDLQNAYASLGRIIGEEVGDDLINEIFSGFCMGK